ncbi:MAG: 4Fe-4S binding protein, partial [Desulfarculaceae bacterium]|nr:4Fe-4S binding protein [Desulfarculaceae bacterium]MCF8098595.1 4Fe-4S binding protein [Desulfarculaceae bacterium]MCF8124134.1 4Fe-4S binding protein [Desulfarculaceae bacterium]
MPSASWKTCCAGPVRCGPGWRPKSPNTPRKVRALDNRLYSKGQLLSMEACTGCAACAEACPAVAASGDGELSGLYRLDWRRKAGKAGAGWLRRLFGGK